ncbi:MAG: fumarylacetoacetate hydrolase family protein, partial [Clostridium sp.]|nr:fumarylacetoacetate hydrolase family protein [Clostridium sp.]
DGKEVMPFKPLSYRDFMLGERHLINSSRGFTKRLMPKVVPIVKAYEWVTHKPFPAFIPKKPWYENPVYYKGNILSFVGNGETIRYPKYAILKDYELELGMIITKDILNATEEEGFGAIGAFCVFNDFSARNVQLDEMRKTGFGPCKSKDFASAISSVVVTADEILPLLDELKTRVYINDKKVASGQLNEFYHSLGKAVAYASKGEKVYSGEFMATGTIPNCSGMENGVLLECGDVIRLEIDKIGELTNTISTEFI